MLIAEEEDAEAGVGELCIKSPAMFQGYWRNPNVRAAFINYNHTASSILS